MNFKNSQTGIDEADADQVIKAISDAPLPRKGPLPQDFQDALSIIFDRKPDDEIAATVPDQPAEPPIIPTPSIIAEPLSAEEVLQQQQQQQAAAMQLMMDEQSQQSMDLYSAFAVVNGVAMLKTDHLAGFTNTEEPEIAPLPIHPVGHVPLPPTPHDGENGGTNAEKAEVESSDSRDAELKAARQAELDDLAMLGIDADDLAAQCM